MRLSQLAQQAAPYVLTQNGDCEIDALTQDSRVKTRNGLFFCIAGTKHDAHDFAPQALQKGAVALVVTQPMPELAAPQIVVSDARAAMALMAAAFYGHPSQQMKMVGITGTKGKTTTSFFVKAILEAAGYTCGLIGTTGNMIGNKWLYSSLTTPDPIDLQATLHQMSDAGVTALSMEVSAHALAMHRLQGMHFEAGCYTNLSQDHLDYFADLQQYFEAKRSFFTSGMVRNAALNADDDYTQQIISQLRIPYSTYGICTNADVFARNIEISENGVRFELSLWNEHAYPIRLQMMGMFNVYNALAAAASTLILGIDPQTITRGLENVRSVPGRAEVLETHTPYKVILDYSHSPDALQNILKTVKSFARKRTIVVFGCGGDRDHSKRPIMGAIAGKMADFSILTSDNPRTEEPMAILQSIEEGMKTTSGKYCLIENRKEAIRTALDLAKDGDVVILAGKGHETYQEINGVKRPFDEKQIVYELLQEKKRSQVQNDG